MKSLLKGKLGKVLLPLLLFIVFFLVPSVSMGAVWVHNVGLLPDTAIVFSSDAPAIDRMMAAALKSVYGNRIGICDGVNDHVEIQAALDAARSAKLSVGQFNCEATANILNSNQALRGCGRNTILTTSTTDLIFLSAVGGAGTELTGIVIADLQIDGGAGAISDCGIYFEYVDYSFIQSVYSRRHAAALGVWAAGILLYYSDFNTVLGNICQENYSYGICVDFSVNNIISANTCQGNALGIYVVGSSNIITGNTCQGNTETGIYLDAAINNTIIGNICQGNDEFGISLSSTSNDNIVSGNTCIGNGHEGILLFLSPIDNNTISGNTCIANSQEADNTYDNIRLEDSSYNLIEGNLCRAGALANKPRYGISISNANCNKNVVQGNDLYDSGKTANFNNAGTLTTVEDNNRGISVDQIKMFRYMKNTSGAQCVAGDVVSLKAVAAGNEVTAPAAIGERQVYGMVAETIDNNAWGLVQVRGKTTALKATNVGGGNIAIGDNLITENGVRARKAAAATDPIFAWALEALAAADGVIDAYIMSPWD